LIRRGSLVRVQPDPPSSWGISSAGRAPALQAGGRRFDPVILHHHFEDLSSRCREWPFQNGCWRQRLERVGCCSLTIRRVESESSTETASWRTVPSMTFLIASPKNQLVRVLKNGITRNTQTVLDDASTARRQSYRVK
jgi:hypothetical protein